MSEREIELYSSSTYENISKRSISSQNGKESPSHSPSLPTHSTCHHNNNHTQYQQKQQLLSSFHPPPVPPHPHPHTISTKPIPPLLIPPLPQHMQITVLPASFSSSFSLHRTNLHCFLLLVRVSIRINSTMLTLDVDPLRYLSKSRDGMVYWQCCGRLSRRRQACAKQRRIVDGARFSS